MHMYDVVNPGKKGTVILSHYRSGGTQLVNTISNVIESEENSGKGRLKKGYTLNFVGEVDFDWESEQPLLSQWQGKIDDGWNGGKDYKIMLINNPGVIDWLVSTKSAYGHTQMRLLCKEFEVMVLERQNKIQCITSLPLWERLIDEKAGTIHRGMKYENSELFNNELDVTDYMIKFHNKLLKNPIPATEITLGWENGFVDISWKDKEPKGKKVPIKKVKKYLHNMMRLFNQEIFMLNTIQREYALHKIYYEEFEGSAYNLEKLFPQHDHDTVQKVLSKSSKKIPYIHPDYVDYFEKEVKDIAKQWGLIESNED